MDLDKPPCMFLRIELHISQKSRDDEMAAEAYKYLLKLILIGVDRTGKTSIMFKWTDDTFNEVYISTIG